MKTFFLTLFILTLLSINIYGQQTSIFGSNVDNEFSQAIAADVSGNTFVGAVKNNEGWVFKKNSSNQLIWSKKINLAPSSTFEIASIELVGDTVFGCGWVKNGATIIGGMYFKLNANTGDDYWIKWENQSKTYFSNIRYYNGSYFICGAQPTGLTGYNIKLFRVNSSNGSIIWQSQAKGLSFPGFGIDFIDDVMSMTEINNDKFYLTGRSYVNGATSLNMRTTLIGVDISGTIFLNKYLLYNTSTPITNRFYGMNIKFDGADSLVIAQFGDDNCSACSDYKTSIIKTDLLGNVSWSKMYDIPGVTTELVIGLNITPTNYVIFGHVNHGLSNQKIFLLETNKNGQFSQGIFVTNPSFTGSSLNAQINCGGSSDFINGTHYFAAGGYSSSPTLKDILIIQVDENLNDSSNCFTLTPFTCIETNISPFSNNLNLLSFNDLVTMQNGQVSSNQTYNDVCDQYSLSVNHQSNCLEDQISLSISGVSNASFNWSNGHLGSTFISTLEDTLFVTVTNLPNCCIIEDTILPVILDYQVPIMNLGQDTSICFSGGNSFDIVPEIINGSLTDTYTWSNSQTGIGLPNSLTISSSNTYWLTINNLCYSISDTIEITEIYSPSLTNQLNYDLCEGNFPLTFNPLAFNYDTFTWNDNYLTLNRTIDSPGIYTLTLENFCGIETYNINVTSIPFPIVSLPTNIDTCLNIGESFLLDASAQYATNVVWNNMQQTQQIEIENSGFYFVNGSNICGSVSDSIQINITNFPYFTLSNELDTCFNDSTVTINTEGSDGQYAWNTGENTPYISINTPGIYICTLTNNCGVFVDSIKVRELTTPSINLLKDSLIICYPYYNLNQLIESTDNNINYYDEYYNSISPFVEESGKYYLTSSNSCYSSFDSIYLDLQETFFYLPNSFTPNEDETNKLFKDYGTNYNIVSVNIYNRWGEVIYNEENKFSGWDGSYKNKPCPDGIYFVRVIYSNCYLSNTEFNGHITLIR